MAALQRIDASYTKVTMAIGNIYRRYRPSLTMAAYITDTLSDKRTCNQVHDTCGCIIHNLWITTMHARMLIIWIYERRSITSIGYAFFNYAFTKSRFCSV